MEILAVGSLFLAYVGVLIYLANLNDLERVKVQTNVDDLAYQFRQRTSLVRWMMFGLVALALLFGLFVLQLALIGPYSRAFQQAELQIPSVDTTSALVFFAFTLVVCVICVRLIVSPHARSVVSRLIGSQGT
jgi:hypothetical protein